MVREPQGICCCFCCMHYPTYIPWVPDTWSGTRQVTVNIGRLEAFHVLFLWLLMNVFLFFVPRKGTALLPVCTIVIVLEW
jgi:hypothetical protein